jgi:hypothetical protein|nr:hypothetical protein [Kofleriaceae bacterium]
MQLLDEPVGMRFENNERQAALTIWLLSAFTVFAIAWMLYLILG